jgi:hypothetical protein
MQTSRSITIDDLDSPLFSTTSFVVLCSQASRLTCCQDVQSWRYAWCLPLRSNSVPGCQLVYRVPVFCPVFCPLIMTSGSPTTIQPY